MDRDGVSELVYILELAAVVAIILFVVLRVCGG